MYRQLAGNINVFLRGQKKMTNVSLQILAETLESVNELIETRNSYLTTKRIRVMMGINGSNKSKIHSISLCLRHLWVLGILERIDRTSKIKYKIKIQEKIDIPEFIDKIGKN